MMDPYKIFTVYMVTNDKGKGSFLICFKNLIINLEWFASEISKKFYPPSIVAIIEKNICFSSSVASIRPRKKSFLESHRERHCDLWRKEVILGEFRVTSG